jgi:rhodanese-related sulfurtransferase
MNTLTVAEVKEMMDRRERMVFDARNPQAWQHATTTLPRAVRIPADQVAAHLGEIPRGRTVITCCT